MKVFIKIIQLTDKINQYQSSAIEILPFYCKKSKPFPDLEKALINKE